MNTQSLWNDLDFQLFRRNVRRLKKSLVAVVEAGAKRSLSPWVKEANALIWKANRPIAKWNQRLCRQLGEWKNSQSDAPAAKAPVLEEDIARMEGEGPLPGHFEVPSESLSNQRSGSNCPM